MNEKALNVIIKQLETCRAPEVQEAIKEQKRLAQISSEKRIAFDNLMDQSITLLRIGSEKFYNKYPQYKEDLPQEDIKFDIALRALELAVNNPERLFEILSRMDEIDELKRNKEITDSLTKAFYEYIVSFSELEDRLKQDREKLFSKEYRNKMASYADNGVLLYFLETPDFPILDADITPNDILDSLYCGNSMNTLFSSFFKMKNVGVSMERKMKDLALTIDLLFAGEYRTAARNLFALLDSEHKKAANAYEGILSKRKEYKKGFQRSIKIGELVDRLDDEWYDEAWNKIDQYYAKVVATNPQDGVIHRNSIVHGDYDSQLIDVDRYSVAKLLLLWLNMRLMADIFCNKEEIFSLLIQYLPAIIMYLKTNHD